jgi:hypothetical protein
MADGKIGVVSVSSEPSNRTKGKFRSDVFGGAIVDSFPLQYITHHPQAKGPQKMDSEMGRNSNMCPYFYMNFVARKDDGHSDNVGSLNTYDTGISFIIPKGRYLMIHGTDDLTRQGYFLPNPIIIYGDDKTGITARIYVELFKLIDRDDIVTPSGPLLRATYHITNFAQFDMVNQRDMERIERTGNLSEREMMESMFRMMRTSQPQQPQFFPNFSGNSFQPPQMGMAFTAVQPNYNGSLGFS